MNALSQLTYTSVFLAVFARQLCLPVPALLFLMTAGALSAHGHLHVSFVILAGVLGCLAGDGVWFWLGRRWGSRVMRLVCRLSSDPKRCSKKARNVFDRWGLRVLIVAKFVPGLDGVTPPLAGAEGSSVASFLLFDGMGSLLWSAGYTALGFLFADQLDLAIHGAERFGTIFGAVIGIPLLLYISWRIFIMVRMMRQLRLHRMSPALLDQKLRAGEKIAVIDLLDFEDREQNEGGIPGAVRANPARLRTGPIIVVPDDVEMVLYCSSQREIISARVAIALQHRGVHKVWVLDGGLKAWRSQGFPVTTMLSSAEEVAERLGILLPPPQSSVLRKEIA
ncbi:VTT domain-containing protein [Terriglobus saanensis]|uniref:Rhodanese domain protein n=1 Tax=Terriglobus saanensis (strain ATCC BAA-1853 / DSM 23119 / SP1PR4) TaxID=401053 RepID=E8V7V5_TERSS|nr:VTT domain-containing protein [Terriglobus saanensis]ADV82879.1 Rhodanese domain protein [Terriglobus saanensis SP1PR4]